MCVCLMIADQDKTMAYISGWFFSFGVLYSDKILFTKTGSGWDVAHGCNLLTCDYTCW